MNKTDFENTEYLKIGNHKQQQVSALLTRHQVMQQLREFDPILAGTIPIAIDIETSDLDIVCYWKDQTHFITSVREHFGNQPRFVIRELIVADNVTVIANFKLEDFEVELFGQAIPSREQNAYRHMLIEWEILMKYGEPFRINIIELKKQGLKTEPAFAHLLGLEGDPYMALLNYTP